MLMVTIIPFSGRLGRPFLRTSRKLAQDLGDTAHAGHIDVTDRSSVDRAIDDFAAHTGGRMNVLCNNAGIFEYRRRPISTP